MPIKEKGITSNLIVLLWPLATFWQYRFWACSNMIRETRTQVFPFLFAVYKKSTNLVRVFIWLCHLIFVQMNSAIKNWKEFVWRKCAKMKAFQFCYQLKFLTRWELKRKCSAIIQVVLPQNGARSPQIHLGGRCCDNQRRAVRIQKTWKMHALIGVYVALKSDLSPLIKTEPRLSRCFQLIDVSLRRQPA